MKFSLRAVADALGVSLPANPDAMVTGWSVDSRTLQPGDLFFALRGPVNDGHAHVAEVFEKGAVAAVVEESVDGGPLLRVDDSLRALQELAAWARREWRGDVVAVTGSAGKTTTKDVIAEMLATEMATAKNQGNLNNHVGLPLSLLRLEETARVAVLEMGMNHAGEIRELAAIARPDVGVVTNVGYAHIENFESIEGIAAAKRELVEALSDRGTAVLNADDARVAAFAAAHRGPHAFSTANRRPRRCAPKMSSTRAATDLRACASASGAVHFESALTGRHSVSNLLAGIAVAGVYGIAPERLSETVRQLTPGKMRGETLRSTTAS